MITIVTGFGRCGSTMLMRMLDAGGMRVQADSRASFELNALACPRPLDWSTFDGYAVKVLDPQHWDFSGATGLRFVFLSRDAREQACSQVKFLEAAGVRVPAGSRRIVEQSLRGDYLRVAGLMREHACLWLYFGSVLACPEGAAERLAGFLGKPLDVAAMAAVVERRSPRCRPDMSYELARIDEEMKREVLARIDEERNREVPA